MSGDNDSREYLERFEVRRRRILALLGTTALGSMTAGVAEAAPGLPTKKPKPKAKPKPKSKRRSLKRFKKISAAKIKARKLPPQEGKLQVARVQVGQKTKGKHMELLRVIPPGKPAEISTFVRHTSKGKASVPLRIKVDGKEIQKSVASAKDKKEVASAVNWTPTNTGKYTLMVEATAQGALAEKPSELSDNAVAIPVYVDPWGDWAKDFIEAVAHGVNLWRLQAKFVNIIVNGVVAIGTPGCLDGPSLEPLIKTQLAGSKMPSDIQNALAKAYATVFESWQSQVTVPGLPWYPAFAAWPGPEAPPLPNVTMSLFSCPSAKVQDLIDPTRIVDRMQDELGGTGSEVQRIALEDIATVLSLRGLMWLASSTVQSVLGKGPVPTFAPPYVPVGPVVMGDVIPTPGVIRGQF